MWQKNVVDNKIATEKREVHYGLWRYYTIQTFHFNNVEQTRSHAVYTMKQKV